MRISSPFRDYYDSLMSREDTHVYRRVPQKLGCDHPTSKWLLGQESQHVATGRAPLKPIGPPIFPENGAASQPVYGTTKYEGWRHPYSYNGVAVVFCGRLYHGVLYREQWHRIIDGSAQYKSSERFYWTAEQFDAQHPLVVPKKSSARHHFEQRQGDYAAHLESIFSVVTNESIMQLCFDHQTPIITLGPDDKVYNRHTAVLHGRLMDLEFIKAVDANTAFQEVSMFVGGVMTKREVIAPVSDAVKIQSHGMDKTSFRRAPTKVR